MSKEKFNRLCKKIGYSSGAVKELYNYYYPLIVTHINRCFRGKLDGRDVAHQFFIKLFKIQVKESVNYPTSWVYKIADYTAIEMLRKEDKRKVAEANAATENKIYIKDDTKEILNCLDEPAREIIYLRYWEDYTLKEISMLLNINYSSVKYIHKKAKVKLENKIRKEQRK